jgi:hypothetical protein
LEARRRALIARSDEQRAALAGQVDRMGRRLGVADAVITTARRIHKNRALVGAAAVGLLLIPGGTRKWVRNLLWAAPILVEGYRFVRAIGDPNRRQPEVASKLLGRS